MEVPRDQIVAAFAGTYGYFMYRSRARGMYISNFKRVVMAEQKETATGVPM